MFISPYEKRCFLVLQYMMWKWRLHLDCPPFLGYHRACGAQIVALQRDPWHPFGGSDRRAATKAPVGFCQHYRAWQLVFLSEDYTVFLINIQRKIKTVMIPDYCPP